MNWPSYSDVLLIRIPFKPPEKCVPQPNIGNYLHSIEPSLIPRDITRIEPPPPYLCWNLYFSYILPQQTFRAYYLFGTNMPLFYFLRIEITEIKMLISANKVFFYFMPLSQEVLTSFWHLNCLFFSHLAAYKASFYIILLKHLIKLLSQYIVKNIFHSNTCFELLVWLFRLIDSHSLF